MSIEPIAPEFQKQVPTGGNLTFAEIGTLFQDLLLEEGENNLESEEAIEGNGGGEASLITMPYPSEDDSDETAELTPMTQALGESEDGSPALETMSALLAMTSGEDWTYDREELISQVDTFLTALGVDHHDIQEITEMFPPEGAELDLVRMGKLVTKAGDILAGRVDAAKLAELLPESGMSEAQVQSWLTSMGVEYQRTGELMKAEGEAGGEFNSTLVEDNLMTNLVNTLPAELNMSDIAALLAETVGQGALYESLGALVGDLLAA